MNYNILLVFFVFTTLFFIYLKNRSARPPLELVGLRDIDPECDFCPTYAECDCQQEQPKHCAYTVFGQKRCNFVTNDCYTYCNSTCCNMLQRVIRKALLAGGCTAAAVAFSTALALLAPELLPFDVPLGILFRALCQKYEKLPGGVEAHIPEMAQEMCQGIGKNC